MAKRILLFVATNILIVATISILVSVFGVGNYLSSQGIDYSALAIFCLIVGFSGSIISLLISRMVAKWTMGIQVIDPQRPGQHSELIAMVHRISRSAGLSVMPEVGIYDSPEVNAFATGPTRSRALVAFSSGILQSMSRDEIEGVAAHEVAHIANGDMVTMMLIQGALNAFVMFLSRIIAFAITQAMRGDKDSSSSSGYYSGSSLYYSLISSVLQIALGLLSLPVIMYFSRIREFRADAGSARYSGRQKMIAALQSLLRHTDEAEVGPARPSIQLLKISSGNGGFSRFFSSHPPLEERIRRLQEMRT